jgi:PhnB protein
MAKKKTTKTTKKPAKKKSVKKPARKAAKKTVKKAIKTAAVKKARRPSRSVRKVPARTPAAVVTVRTTSINPYLTFCGNCEEAFNFYKKVFGGEFTMLSRFKDTPAEAGMPVPAHIGEQLMHVSLPIGKNTILMGSDGGDMPGGTFVEGSNFSISVNAVSKDEADKIFHGLAEGGHVTMTISMAFWGAYFGMLKDKFGIRWMVSFDQNAQNT